jgi:hypothetical protein
MLLEKGIDDLVARPAHYRWDCFFCAAGEQGTANGERD